MKNTREFYIEINGTPRRCRFKYLGLCWFKEKHNKSITEIFKEGSDLKVDEFDLIIDLVYAGIMADAPDLKLEDIQSEFELALMKEWTQTVFQAFEAAMPDVPEGKERTRAKARS